MCIRDRWTLDATSGTDTSVTLNPGANINISAITTSGNDRSFTLAATNTTYLLKCTKDSNGGSTGTDSNPYLFLDASGTGTDDSVRMVGAGGLTITRNNDGQLTIDGSGSGTTYDLGTRSTPSIRLTGSDASTDDITFSGTGNILSLIHISEPTRPY